MIHRRSPRCHEGRFILTGRFYHSLLAGISLVGVLSWPCAAAADDTKSIVIAAVSCEVKIRDTAGNLDRIEAWTKRAAARGADLVLFPECAIHGWWQSRENRKFAETIDGPSIARVAEIARRHQITIAVGMTERDGERFYLTHVIVGPNGVVGRRRTTSRANYNPAPRTPSLLRSNSSPARPKTPLARR